MNDKELDEFYSQSIQQSNNDDNLGMPLELNDRISVYELLDNTNPKHIYLTSDWHFFKNHYKKEHNYVNTQNILTWCRQNIKENDVFMYLGDISFRYANEEDQKESQRLLASIPGHKILIIGNHDTMLGQDYFTNCGFHYVYDILNWQNIVFTHKPIPMEIMPKNYLNIHGHIHNIKTYNNTDGKRNINVYPLWYNNKPVSLDYCLNHVDKLVKDNSRSDWTQIDESAEYRDIEDLDINLETLRSNLKDSQFGIPEDRKFPLDSKKHVMSAIKLFGHAEESKKKALARRIKTAANKYNVEIPETTQVNKYLSESDLAGINFSVENMDAKMNEWSMAAINPVIGITKPYVLKIHNDCGGLLNAKRYALATDLVSDKYLVINEDANLEIVSGANLSNMIVEEYEFIGDKRLLKKIEEAYYSKKTVDNTFFYTTLTGKPMLTEDQIDFDSNFRKVNFIAMKEKSLSKFASLKELFDESIGITQIKVNIIPNNHTKQLIGNKSYISIMKDLDGYYLLNTEKNIRSASVEEQNFLTEEIIHSIL